MDTIVIFLLISLYISVIYMIVSSASMPSIEINVTGKLSKYDKQHKKPKYKNNHM